MRPAALALLLLAACSYNAFDPFGVEVDREGRPTTCSDHRLSEGETDVDCGGPCTPCADGKACLSTDDCARSECLKGVCGGATECDPRGTDQCNGRCGDIVDGCGTHHACGGCTSPASCGGGGTANVCGCSGDACGSCTPRCSGVECGSDGCNGSCGTCTNPPAARCDGNVLVIATGAGTCGSGRCTYPETRTTCANGCDGGACVTTTTTCTAPNRLCDGTCAACPTSAGVTGTICRATSCIATGCAPEWEGCGTSCCRMSDQVVDDGLSGADVALASDGTVHVAYLRTYGGAPSAFYAKSGASGFTTERIGSAAAGFVSVSLGPGGTARADYAGTQAGWMHADRATGSWAVTPISGIVGVAQAASDPDGIAYAIGTDFDSRYPNQGHLGIASFDGTNAAFTASLEYQQPGNAYPSLAVNGFVLGAAYVVRSDSTNQWSNGGLKAGSTQGAAGFFTEWAYSDGSANNGIGDQLGATSVAIDANYKYRVAFVNHRQRNLSLVTEGGAAPVALVARDDVAFVRLVVDAAGVNYAVYATTAGELRLVKGSAAPFADSVLVANAGAKSPFGFVLDANGRPVVAWVDANAGKLRVMRYGP